MGNDMTWEQKCRISALRAACASPYDPVFDPAHLSDPAGNYERIDEQYTKRILARAEVFRIALMSDGALDYTPDDDEATEASMELSNCKYCTRAIGKHDDGTWIDNTGTRYCGSAQTLTHAPTPERELPESNMCPGCGASSRKMPLWIDEQGDVCRHKWHRS